MLRFKKFTQKSSDLDKTLQALTNGNPTFKKEIKKPKNIVSVFVKQLLKNITTIIKEIEKTKELYPLLKKATISKLSKKESKDVKVKLKNILQMLPFIGIHLLPLGSIWLYTVLSLLPYRFVPDAFAAAGMKGK